MWYRISLIGGITALVVSLLLLNRSVGFIDRSRQAVGVYKCCNTVYGAPVRDFNFDTDFLDPAKLPPLTPVFRDINALGFTQETRPGQ